MLFRKWAYYSLSTYFILTFPQSNLFLVITEVRRVLTHINKEARITERTVPRNEAGSAVSAELLWDSYFLPYTGIKMSFCYHSLKNILHLS